MAAVGDKQLEIGCDGGDPAGVSGENNDKAIDATADKEMEELLAQLYSAAEKKRQEILSQCVQVLPPDYLTSAKNAFLTNRGQNNFLKGCKWAPDGSCIMTCSEDKKVRLFNLPGSMLSGEKPTGANLPELSPAMELSEPEPIYDFCWYPNLNSTIPSTCFLATTCRDNPVHLWDAFNSELRASFKAMDYAEELLSAKSLCMSETKLYCGLQKNIRIFNLNRPGVQCESINTVFQEQSALPGRSAKKSGQTGIISCICLHPDMETFAVGSYDKTVCMYSEKSGKGVCMLHGHQGGVTHIVISRDGKRLYSGERRHSEILCWDLRNPGEVLFTMNRFVHTNQRYYFELSEASNNKFLVSGSQGGNVHMWDTSYHPSSKSSAEGDEADVDPVLTFKAHDDACCGISIHPAFPVLATASGQRKFNLPICSDEEDEDEEANIISENCLKLWWMNLSNTAAS